MLKKATKEERDKYIDFAYELAMDPTRSSYPVFFDGIKTKEDFIRATNFAFENNSEELLIFIKNEEIYGWIQYYLIEDENQIATYTFLCDCHHEQMVDEFIEYITKKYSNSNMAVGLPYENSKVRERLFYHNFKLEEKSYNCVLNLENYVLLEEINNAQKLEKENFNEVKNLHDKIDIDMYWNSKRIFEEFDNWLIYIYKESNEVTGVLYCMNETRLLEVFGIDYKDNIFSKKILISLFAKFLNDCKKNGNKNIVYFAETLEEVEYLNKFGFKLIGEYNYFLLKNIL